MPDHAKLRAEISHIESLLSTRELHRLKFNQPVLELSFRDYYREHINQILKQNFIINLILSLVYVIIGAFLVPLETIYQWFGLYFIVCFSTLLTLFAGIIKKSERIEGYIAAAGFFSMVFVLAGIHFTHPDMHFMLVLSVLMICFSCYASTLLTFRLALATCALSLFTGLSLLLFLGAEFNLQYTLFIIISANLVGMTICFLNEFLLRKSFLQRYLLTLEKRQLRHLSRQFESQSLKDALTNIANRRHFNINYKLEWVRCHKNKQPTSLIFIDIDHFKKYNDFYGHHVGDNCLKNIARSLDLTLTRSRDMVSRYGGEEFIALLPGTDQDGAIKIAEKIRNQVLKLNIPHESSPIADHITISMGIATTTPSKTDKFSDLIKMADKALYKAKSNGRNQWALYESNHTLESTHYAYPATIMPETTMPFPYQSSTALMDDIENVDVERNPDHSFKASIRHKHLSKKPTSSTTNSTQSNPLAHESLESANDKLMELK